MPVSRQKRDEIADRRRKIAALLLVGRSIEQMRADLAGQGIEVSHGTVVSDTQQVRRMWRDESTATYETHVARQLAEIDAVKGRVIQAAISGDRRAQTILPQYWREKARLLGLDAPMRIEAKVEMSAWMETLDGEVRVLFEQADQDREAIEAATAAIEAESTVREAPTPSPAGNGSAPSGMGDPIADIAGS